MKRKDSDILTALTPFVRLSQKPYMDFYETCNTPNAYADMLFQTWYYVKETVPTIKSVINYCPNHPLADKLRTRFEEELDHDIMLLNDLSLVNIPIDKIPSPFIEEFVQIENNITQYQDPVSEIYGHIAFLECWPASIDWVDSLGTQFEVPNEASSAFRVHASEDEIHMQTAMEEMEHSSLNKKTVLLSSIKTAKLFAQHWYWMVEKHKNT